MFSNNSTPLSFKHLGILSASPSKGNPYRPLFLISRSQYLCQPNRTVHQTEEQIICRNRRCYRRSGAADSESTTRTRNTSQGTRPPSYLTLPHVGPPRHRCRDCPCRPLRRTFPDQRIGWRDMRRFGIARFEGHHTHRARQSRRRRRSRQGPSLYPLRLLPRLHKDNPRLEPQS